MAYANQPTEHLIQDENDLFACKHEHKMRNPLLSNVATMEKDEWLLWALVNPLLLIQLTG